MTPLEALNDLREVKGWKDEEYNKRLDIIETALKRLVEHDKTFKKYDIDDNWLEACLYVIKYHFPIDTETKLKKLQALDIFKEDIKLQMSVDEDVGCLYVPLHKKQVCIVGYIKGKEKIDLLKEVLYGTK